MPGSPPCAISRRIGGSLRWRIDYEAEYNNRARVPEHPADLRALAAGRRRLPRARPQRGRAELGITYGPSRAADIDLFYGQRRRRDAPLALFIHGGYWRSLEPRAQPFGARPERARRRPSRSRATTCCRRCRSRRSSSRCGGLPVSVEAVRQAHHGLRPFRRRPSRRLHDGDRLEGARRDAPADLVPAGYAISGVFDLAPLAASRHAMPTSSSTKPSARRIRRCSGRRRTGRVLDVVVGARRIAGIPAAEQDHRRRLGRRAASRPATRRCPAPTISTSCDPLTDPDSAMTERLSALVERTNGSAEPRATDQLRTSTATHRRTVSTAPIATTTERMTSRGA